MKTATPKKSTKKNVKKAGSNGKKTIVVAQHRSPLVQAILENLDRRSWMTREELTDKVGHLISKKDALKVYAYRIDKNGTMSESEKVKVRRGRETQVMLTCITLVQYKKLEQDGRGETKRYRLMASKV